MFLIFVNSSFFKFQACQVLLNNRSIQSYLKNIATSQLHMISHWFTRIEYALLTNMLKFSSLKVIIERNIIFPIAYKLSYLLSQEFQKELIFIMREIIFNKNYFPEERRLENINLENELNLLDNLKDTCECYISVLGLDQVNSRDYLDLIFYLVKFLFI